MFSIPYFLQFLTNLSIDLQNLHSPSLNLSTSQTLDLLEDLWLQGHSPTTPQTKQPSIPFALNFCCFLTKCLTLTKQCATSTTITSYPEFLCIIIVWN
jgi:hypothetical protein